MSLFEQHITYPVVNGLKSKDGGVELPFNHISRFCGNIEQGKIIAISGRESSGKKSYMDHAYMMTLLIDWRDSIYQKDSDGKVMIDDDTGVPLDIPNAERAPLSILYFCNKTPLRIKVQKLLCLYLRMEYKMVIDIPTLNSKRGKMYDLTQDDITRINSAEHFFDLIEREVIQFYGGDISPTDLRNHVIDYMATVGSQDEVTFQYEYRNSTHRTFVFLEDLDSLAIEKSGFTNLDGAGLKDHFNTYVKMLKKVYNVTSIFTMSPSSSYVRTIKDSEPDYRDIGVFRKSADLGVVLYNPYNENNVAYNNFPIEDLVIQGKERFRSVTIVKNSTGRNNITIGTIFLGECGYFSEAEAPSNLEWYTQIITLLKSFH